MSSLFTYDNFVHALAGSVASGTAMVVFYPLDTVRSRLQLEQGREAKSTLATMQDLIDEEGIACLYQGLKPVLYSLFASGFVYFYSFHGIRRVMGEKTTVKDLAIGAVAGSINVMLTTPLWVVNTRIKMASKLLSPNQARIHSNQLDYQGLVDGLISIVKKEGAGALWSGAIPSLVLVSNPAVQFAIFELLKRNLQTMQSRKELHPFHVFALGAFSDLDAARESIESARQQKESSVYPEVVVPLLEAMYAFKVEDYITCTRLLEDIRHDVVRIGGSHAQRDVFEQLLTVAAGRSKLPAHKMLYARSIDERNARMGLKKQTQLLIRATDSSYEMI